MFSRPNGVTSNLVSTDKVRFCDCVKDFEKKRIKDVYIGVIFQHN